jgi:hypothetical protein
MAKSKESSAATAPNPNPEKPNQAWEKCHHSRPLAKTKKGTLCVLHGAPKRCFSAAAAAFFRLRSLRRGKLRLKNPFGKNPCSSVFIRG